MSKYPVYLLLTEDELSDFNVFLTHQQVVEAGAAYEVDPGCDKRIYMFQLKCIRERDTNGKWYDTEE